MSSKMDIVYKTEAVPRRESFDSGIGSPDSSPGSSSSSDPNPNLTRRRNKKKKRLASTLSSSSFSDIYSLKNDVLGQGSYGIVETCVNIYTNMEYAVKIINKDSWAFNRQKMLKEIELYYLCQGNESIIQLIDYFEEDDKFYLIFEKAKGGHLLNQIQQRIKFSENEAAMIMAKLAKALKYLHSRGIAHRDLKPENILCMENGENEVASSVRLCDFDLCSKVQPSVSTPRLQSPVGSPEYLAPEVVEVFVNDDIYDLLDEDEDLTYDKRCDLWSLGVIAYTLLSGCLPFRGHCGEDCGWDDRNEECFNCQEDLFNAIRRSKVPFPDAHWAHISKPAKDLISKLLKIDPNQRIEASEVLNHPWIVKHTSSAAERSAAEVAADHLVEVAANHPAADVLAKDEVADVLVGSPNTLRRAMSSSFFYQNPSSIQTGVKASAKLRRQSSVVTFCGHHESPDLYIRCEL